jgi:hypothetical protein
MARSEVRWYRDRVLWTLVGGGVRGEAAVQPNAIRASAMTKISAGTIWFHKRLFPVIWFGFLLLFVIVAVSTGASRKDFVLLVIPVAMGVFGYFLMKSLIWNLVDEVYDCGDELLVRNRGDEDRIGLSSIMNVSVTTFMNPPRITLRLISPSKFRNEIAFSPVKPFTLNPFAKNPVAEDLIERVYRARAERGR